MKKYYGLYEKIKNDILGGVYKAKDKLPSKRDMAEMTGYSQITVMTAYDMLEAEGYIISRERRGYFVCDVGGFLPSVSGKREKELAPPSTSPSESFEYSVWFKTVRKVIAEKGKELFIKAESEGCAVLRNAISNYLYKYRGMNCSPRQIVVGSGAEQLYESVVKILGRDKVFGIENPCYEQIKKVYAEEGVKTLPLEMGDDGITTKSLAKGGFEVLHVTPFSSYPSNVTAPVTKRYEYVSWAKTNGGYIVEDDYKSEFSVDKLRFTTLKSLLPENVIYVNTFSKSLSPSMRIGYMVLPEKLVPVYKERLGGFACSVPVLDQYVLAEFISSGSFERHLNRIRRKIKRGEK